MRPTELEKLIKADGWKEKPGARKGSHRQYEHPTKPGKVTIPFHKGKDVHPDTVRSILKQAGLK